MGTAASKTPWQKVVDKLGMSGAQVAEAMGRHRSKLSRVLKDPHGLINGQDQALLVKIAQERKVTLTLADFTPEA